VGLLAKPEDKHLTKHTMLNATENVSYRFTAQVRIQQIDGPCAAEASIRLREPTIRVGLAEDFRSPCRNIGETHDSLRLMSIEPAGRFSSSERSLGE
jgi:hypothetical protein